MARSLEQRWEEILRAERGVRDDYDRFLRQQPPQLSPEERARIAALSCDLPAFRPRRCGAFYPELVHELLVRRGLANEKTYVHQLGPHEWWLPKLAAEIPVAPGKLADWARRGWLHSRRTPAQRLWVLWADKQDVKRLRTRHSMHLVAN